jgi:hypothetical protein
MRKRLIFIFGLILVLGVGGVCRGENETLLWGKDYFEFVQRGLEGADNSIYMIMYRVSFDAHNKDSLVYRLMDSLVKAKDRGVEVKVILDYDWEAVQKNKRAFDFLRENGVDVFYDDVSTVTHSKVLVIDRKMVIVGSTNWTEAALGKSNELSVGLESEELAREIIEHFKQIKLIEKEAVIEKSPLLVYRRFMEGEDLASRMIRTSDERAFDMYLFLLKEFDGNPKGKLVVDYEKLADGLGLAQQMDRISYRRQINRSLKKLKDTYGLINLSLAYGREGEVQLLDYNDKMKSYEHPGSRFFALPAAYWDEGWNRRLALREKYCYFINLYMLSFSEAHPYWQGSINGLAKMFAVSPWFIQKGMQELRRLNIIEIEYSEFIGDRHPKGSNTKYKLVGLYSPQMLEKSWKDLAVKFGEEKVKLARKFAGVVFKENDPEIIEKMIGLINKYGQDKVEAAIRVVAEKSVQNPKRSFSYLVGILNQGKVER